MPTTEQLLQELVDLKKEEVRRMRREGTIKLLFHTIPSFIFFVLMVWGSYQIYQKTMGFFENVPDFSQGTGFTEFFN